MICRLLLSVHVLYGLNEQCQLLNDVHRNSCQSRITQYMRLDKIIHLVGHQPSRRDGLDWRVQRTTHLLRTK